MFSLPTLLSIISLTTTLVSSQMIPTSPDASTVVNVGSSLTAQWSEDTTGAWTDVTMKLMTGDNYQMVEVVTIATSLDTTTTSSYTFAAPDVTPNSAIYFLQFQPSGNASAYEWTTRFTIASTDGTTTTPTNSTQSDGSAIPWGTGTLVGSYATNSGSSSAATLQNSTTTSTTSTSTGTGGLSVIAATASDSTATATDSTSAATGTASGSTAVVTASSSGTSSAASSTTSASSGAGKRVGGGGAGAGVFGALGLVVLVGTVW